MKKIIKICVFIIVFIFLWTKVFDILWMDKYAINDYYKEPKNTIDVVYIGHSNVYMLFNPTIAYDIFGYKTGLVAVPGLPFIATKNFLIEAQKTQNPKLYIIDISKLATVYGDSDIRWAVDSMNMSLNRMQTVKLLLDHATFKTDDAINYYFSNFLYHNKWKEIKELNFDNNIYYKGFELSTKNAVTQKVDKYIWDEEIIPLSTELKDSFLDLINYIKVNGLPVLFVASQRNYDKNEQKQINDAFQILAQNNLEYINFNTYKDFQLDETTDFYNKNHANVFGSMKYTLYFGNYLKEHYQIDNQKEKKIDASWMEEYERMKEDFNKLTKKDFNKTLQNYQNELGIETK